MILEVFVLKLQTLQSLCATISDSWQSDCCKTKALTEDWGITSRDYRKHWTQRRKGWHKPTWSLHSSYFLCCLTLMQIRSKSNCGSTDVTTRSAIPAADFRSISGSWTALVGVSGQKPLVTTSFVVFIKFSWPYLFVSPSLSKWLLKAKVVSLILSSIHFPSSLCEIYHIWAFSLFSRSEKLGSWFLR